MEEKKVKMLSHNISLLNDINEDIAERKMKFEESIQNIIDTKKSVVDLISTLKGTITMEALEEFEESGNKKLYGGIGIRQTKTLSYPADKALKFAKEKDMFLTLDKKAFEKVAVSLNLDFVESGIVNKVTFPKEIKI